MSRLFSRDEWLLAAAALGLGIITAVLVLVLWFRSMGARSTAELEGPPPAIPTGGTPSPGLATALSRAVLERLAERPVPSRPLRGAASFRARNLVWLEPATGDRFATARAVTGTLDMAAASAGDIVVRQVRLESPEIELRARGETWNYESPLAGVLDRDGSRARGAAGRTTRRFLVQRLDVVGGRVSVDLPARDFTLSGMELRLADVAFSGPGLAAPQLAVVSGRATLDVADGPQGVALASAAGRLSFPNRVTHFDLDAVTVAGTRIERAVGVWDPAQPGYGVTATGVVPAARLADLERLAPGKLPTEGTISTRFAVAPLPRDGTRIELTELNAHSGDSRLGGGLTMEVYPGQLAVRRVALRLDDVALKLLEPFTGPLPYAGTLNGTITGPGSDIRLDVLAALRQEGAAGPFRARLTGGVALQGNGFEFRRLKAELQQVPLSSLSAFVPGLPLAGTVSGTVFLNGSPRTTPIGLDVRLELASGLATVTGTVDLTGAVPRYDVSGRLVGVQLAALLARPAPPVGLTARFSLVGAGFDPATARADVRLTGEFTGWRAQSGDHVRLAAGVAQGEVRVDTLSSALAGAVLDGSGRWRFTAPIAGAVRYRASIASLEPFGPYIPLLGDSVAAGSLRAEGTVSGPLRTLRLAGSLSAEGVRVGGWGAGRLSSTYAVALDSVLPELDVRLDAGDVATEGFGSYRTLTGSVRLQAPVFSLDVHGERPQQGEIAVVAEGTIPRQGARSLMLQRAYFDLEEGRWELRQPARLSWGAGDGLRVSGLELRNARGNGRLALDGRIFPLDDLDAHLAATDVPLEQFQELLGRNTGVRGRLTADLTIRPPGSAPTVDGTFALERASLNGVVLSRLEGRLNYAAGLARGELLAAFDSAAGRLEVRGTLPVRLRLVDSVDVGITQGGLLDATITAERVSLRPFGLLVQRVRNLDGLLDGTVRLEGTVDAPRLDGQLALTQGRVTVPDLNQDFDSIAGVIAFEGRRATIRDLGLHSGGWARLNGTATFEHLDQPVLALTAQLAGFEALGVDDHPDAQASGQIGLNGPLDALVLTGEVDVDDGYVAVPQIGGYRADYTDVIDPTPVLGPEFTPRGQRGWLTALRVENLRVRFGEGAWFEAADATAQLSGTVTLNRAAGDMTVTGTLHGQRGTYTLLAGPIVRRFEITDANVRFLGGTEVNPNIDITARRIVLDPSGRRVEVEVRITGTAQTPRLGLASADAPNIPQAELLAFLLFGRSSFALGQDAATTGEALFEQTFFGGFAELASIELERALSSDLGLQLDLFQVRFGQGFGGVTSPTFVLGRQLSQDVFLTVESGLNALFGENGGAANTWAIRLEWALAPQQTLQLGIEPVNRARLLRGIGAALPPGQPTRQQIYAEYRRRWVY